MKEKKKGLQFKNQLPAWLLTDKDSFYSKQKKKEEQHNSILFAKCTSFTKQMAYKGMILQPEIQKQSFTETALPLGQEESVPGALCLQPSLSSISDWLPTPPCGTGL